MKKSSLFKILFALPSQGDTRRYDLAGGIPTLFFLFFLLVFPSGCQKKVPQSPANVLIISIDALNRNALRVYNENAPELEFLDRLAKKSLVFDNAYSPSSWTLPAHASLFTGMNPDKHGANHTKVKMAPDVKTMAGLLKEAGFRTAAFTDEGFVSRVFGLEKGFDIYDDWVDPEISWSAPKLPRDGNRPEVSGENLFDRGIAFMEQCVEDQQRFFLFLHTYVVHDYFWCHPWALESLPEFEDLSMPEYRDCILGRRECGAEQWKRLENLYQAEIIYMDRMISDLMDTLEKMKIADQTLIVFLSDHGEGFDIERGRIHHGGRLHEDMLRVPLFFSGPGMKPGKTQTSFSLVDMLPTLMSLYNIDIPSGLDGEPYDPTAPAGGQVRRKAVMAMEHVFWWQDKRRYALPNPMGDPISLAVIENDKWFIQGKDRLRFFDMSRDPNQLNPLTPDNETAEHFRKIIAREGIRRIITPRAKVGTKVQDQLRSLGYVK